MTTPLFNKTRPTEVKNGSSSYYGGFTKMKREESNKPKHFRDSLRKPAVLFRAHASYSERLYAVCVNATLIPWRLRNALLTTHVFTRSAVYLLACEVYLFTLQ